MVMFFCPSGVKLLQEAERKIRFNSFAQVVPLFSARFPQSSQKVQLRSSNHLKACEMGIGTRSLCVCGNGRAGRQEGSAGVGLLTLTSVIAMSTMLPTTIKASNVFHASTK